MNCAASVGVAARATGELSEPRRLLCMVSSHLCVAVTPRGLLAEASAADDRILSKPLLYGERCGDEPALSLLGLHVYEQRGLGKALEMRAPRPMLRRLTLRRVSTTSANRHSTSRMSASRDEVWAASLCEAAACGPRRTQASSQSVTSMW